MTTKVFDHVAIGAGVIGFNTTSSVIYKIINNKFIKNKRYNFLIIDKNIKNIIGGVAYNPELASYGYFNNPIRLSPKPFVDFIKKNKKFRFQISNYLKNNGGYIDDIWLKKSFKNLNKPNSKQFNELYLPRASYGIWQEYRLCKLIEDIDFFNKNNLKNIYLNLSFSEAEALSIEKKEYMTQKIITKKKPIIFHIDLDKNKKTIFQKKDCFKSREISCFFITLGIGLNPPRKFHMSSRNPINYIWDFYKEGSTKNLIEIVNKQIKKSKKHKKIDIFFIGLKAGLLEPLPEINQFLLNKENNINIFAISSSLQTIQKAQLINENKKYKFKYLTNANIKNITKASKIIELIKDEFVYSINSGFNKYHVWSKILKDQLLPKMISRLGKSEKNKYDIKYFTILRNITRFTYPYPLEIKDEMIKNKSLVLIKDKVKKINFRSRKIELVCKNNIFKADILVNVSGPQTTNKISNEVPLINNLKNQKFKFDNLGIKVTSNFYIPKNKNIFIPGTLGSGFNPNRVTILKAIFQNSECVSKNIYNRILSACYTKNTFEFIFSNINKLKKTNITKGGITCSKTTLKKINNNVLFNSSEFNYQIIFDGKAGSGKSTIARIFSEAFNIISIDTGYIFKALSLKLYNQGFNRSNLNEINIQTILRNLKNINLRDLTNKKLDNIYLTPLTKHFAKNKLIRKAFNKKIYELCNTLNSFILTGRDTGLEVFPKNKNIYKFFLEVSDHVAAKRKGLQSSNYKEQYKKTLIRNTDDIQNIKSSNDSIVLNNNKNLNIAVKNVLQHLVS